MNEKLYPITVEVNGKQRTAQVPARLSLVDYLRELMARSALITAIFERPDVSVCSHFTHAKLIELIEKRDEQGLVDAMLGHLDEIESYLTLYEKEDQPVDIRSIFSTL